MCGKRPSPRGQHISCDLVQLLFRNYSKELRFKVTPHTLRHTFAARLAEKIAPISSYKN